MNCDIFRLLKIIILLLIFHPVFSIYSLEVEQDKEKEKWVDSIHLRFSNNITRTARGIDSFFGDERAFEEANNSRVQIYSVFAFRESQTPTAAANYNIKLVLPQTEKRFRLIIENTSDLAEKSNTIDPKQPSSTPATKSEATGNQPETERSLTTAIRYLLASRKVKTSFDIGLRYTSKIELFSKFRIRKNLTFGKWGFRPAEEFTWIHDEGTISDLDLEFDKKLAEKWHFRFINNIYWRNRNNIFFFTNGPSWYQKISDRMALSYNIRAKTSYHKGTSNDNYSITLSYRQLLNKKWFYWTVTPALDFPKELEYYRTPSLTIRFDTIFGNI